MAKMFVNIVLVVMMEELTVSDNSSFKDFLFIYNLFIEIFFRVEPKRFMSEAQLMTALRLAFGSEVIKSELVVKKIFSSFDFFLRDEMDWRSFLYLLIILMQPTLTTAEMIK